MVAAHKDLESICLDRDTQHYKKLLSERYAELVYNGKWFTPLREALDAFVEVTQKHMTGTVKLKLYKGSVVPVARKSHFSLYDEDFATFEEDSVYDQSDAEGFIHLFGLPLKVAAFRDMKTGDKIPNGSPEYTNVNSEQLD